MAVGVLCAVRGPAEATIVQGLDGTGGRLSVTRRCADLAELLAAAEAGLGRVAVVSGDLPMLDREAVAALHRCGVSVVGVREPALAWQGERLLALGADLVLETPADPAHAASLARDVLTLLAASTDPLTGRPADNEAPDADLDTGPTFVVPGPVAQRAVRGRVLAVWGPTGAPGRTTLAMNLAAEIALLGRSTLLVDADTYGGTIAQAVGLLDEAPGLAAAARAAGQGTLDVEVLARLSPAIETDLRVLSGIARADRWPELPSASLDVVWTVARALASWTVVDCGFCLEQDESLSYDTHAPRRNAATLSVLADADEILVVGSGDPVGVQRLVRARAELAELATRGRTSVVVNRVRSSAAGPRPGEAISDALERYAGIRAPHLVPDDRASLDRAMLEGRMLHETAPTSPARRAIAALAAAYAGGVAVPVPVTTEPSPRSRAIRRDPARLANG